MDNRDIVSDLYKTLEHAIRRKIPELPPNKSPIWVYCQTLSSYDSGVLDHIRKYRNDNPGHGVGPGCMPAPEWIPFLKKHINTVDRSGDELTQKLRKAMEKASKINHSGGSKGNSNGSEKKASKINHSGGSKENSNGSEKKQSFPTNNSSKSSSAPTPKIKNAPNEYATGKDENLKVKAVLERGDGRYTKGFINKKNMMNFKLRISIKNQEGLRITGVKAQLKGKNDMMEKKLPTSLESVTEFDLPTDTYGGHIEASVIVDYKIGIFKSKQIKLTVSKNF